MKILNERIYVNRKEYDELCHCLLNSILSIKGITSQLQIITKEILTECQRLEDHLCELKQTKYIDELYDI